MRNFFSKKTATNLPPTVIDGSVARINLKIGYKIDKNKVSDCTLRGRYVIS